ncbi:PP2C family protein-serine/threonine phosphatase [Pseudorhodoferax soli]|uniref:Serine/threonine protein phosphatase PrpC n=1 Tax=Pseudorhodoferax soli TaxID=545864 RepID=A0A368YAC6_9BURK|nr:PP2C family serine/threonine-protein phosphatase [Pseudorhodoferax soli]RCW76388.1 serine/threonine protein phosphatase PrpC [Pseudorhodoferax soli]
MRFSVFQVSRRGGRAKNEDRMGYCYTRESGLFVLADGMGGHPEGEAAAQLAVQTLSSLHQQHATPQLPQAGDFLVHALLASHRRILRYGEERGLADKPRTTLVAAVVQGESVTWAHCGDSRLYLVRGGALLARTRDHSYLEQMPADMARAGRVSRNVLYTCLGSPVAPEYQLTGPVALQRGDKILLCSDGLWSSLSDERIVEQLSAMPVAQAVPELVEQALRAAGDTSDNVTALALEWRSADAFASTSGQAPDAFAATVQGTDPKAAVPELDEAAIDRSIAEINEAIRRTAARRN